MYPYSHCSDDYYLIVVGHIELILVVQGHHKGEPLLRTYLYLDSHSEELPLFWRTQFDLYYMISHSFERPPCDTTFYHKGLL